MQLEIDVRSQGITVSLQAIQFHAFCSCFTYKNMQYWLRTLNMGKVCHTVWWTTDLPEISMKGSLHHVPCDQSIPGFIVYSFIYFLWLHNFDWIFLCMSFSVLIGVKHTCTNPVWCWAHLAHQTESVPVSVMQQYSRVVCSSVEWFPTLINHQMVVIEGVP